MTMSDKDFIKGIRSEVIANNLKMYRELFVETRPQDASDPHWKVALQFFHQLDDVGQEIFFGIIRQVMIDTASNIFAIFDGVSDLSGQDGSFDVRIGDKSLSGSLQDHLLAAEEENYD